MGWGPCGDGRVGGERNGKEGRTPGALKEPEKPKPISEETSV